MSSVAFSAAGSVAAGYPADENLQTKMRSVAVVTLGAGETATITHGSDPELTRRVEALNASGASLLAGGSPDVTVIRASATTTTVQSTAGGTIRVVIEL